MIKIIFRFCLMTLSRLPFWVLYGISDLLALAMLLFPYRGHIVASNLRKAFPNKSTSERKLIKRQFYKHFCDLMMESLKLFTIPQKEVVKRFKIMNPEIFEYLKSRNKSAILVGGHYQNWEYFAVASAPQITHKLLGIYTPITNSYLGPVFAASRSRFGLVLVPKKQVKAYFEKYNDQLTVTTFAVDQCPRKHQKVYWTKFLGIDTAVHYGAEKYAKEYNYAVIYGSAIKTKRGHYELRFELLEEAPNQTAEGELTKKHTQKLEQQIVAAPQYWLWTHKRWKLSPSSVT